MFLKHRKTPALESLVNELAGLSGHFEEHLWTTSSEVNTINFPGYQNYSFEWAKKNFATICIDSCTLQLC